jgi:hypothetical protein
MNTPKVGDLIIPNPETYVGTISSISPEGHVTAIFYVTTVDNLIEDGGDRPDLFWQARTLG